MSLLFCSQCDVVAGPSRYPEHFDLDQQTIPGKSIPKCKKCSKVPVRLCFRCGKTYPLSTSMQEYYAHVEDDSLPAHDSPETNEDEAPSIEDDSGDSAELESEKRGLESLLADLRALQLKQQPQPALPVTPAVPVQTQTLQELRDRFQGACAVTRTRVQIVLQPAALVASETLENSFRISSTMLLRADWRLLVEAHEASFRPVDAAHCRYQLVLSVDLQRDVSYNALHLRSVRLPEVLASALTAHWKRFQELHPDALLSDDS